MFVSSLVCFGKITSPFIHLCMSVQYRSLFLYNGESPCYALNTDETKFGSTLVPYGSSLSFHLLASKPHDLCISAFPDSNGWG